MTNAEDEGSDDEQELQLELRCKERIWIPFVGWSYFWGTQQWSFSFVIDNTNDDQTFTSNSEDLNSNKLKDRLKESTVNCYDDPGGKDIRIKLVETDLGGDDEMISNQEIELTGSDVSFSKTGSKGDSWTVYVDVS